MSSKCIDEYILERSDASEIKFFIIEIDTKRIRLRTVSHVVKYEEEGKREGKSTQYVLHPVEKTLFGCGHFLFVRETEFQTGNVHFQKREKINFIEWVRCQESGAELRVSRFEVRASQSQCDEVVCPHESIACSKDYTVGLRAGALK